jgi:hypothetical protein
MRNSYIANTHEAAALHAGKQTAVVVKMKVQPTFRNNQLIIGKWNYGKDFYDNPCWDNYIKWHATYKLGQEVYVREAWAEYKKLYDCMRGCDRVCICNKEYVYNSENLSADERSALQSPANMPQSAARTRFKVLDVEAVRVRDISEEQGGLLNIRGITKDGSRYKYGVCGDDGMPYGSGWKWCDFEATFIDALKKCMIAKIGQQAWGENHYVWFFKIEKL